jgi:serine protease AprX
MKIRSISEGFRVNAVIALLFISANYSLQGQQASWHWYYRVYLTDKGSNATAGYSESDLLSERAIARRQKAGIMVPDIRDVPVEKSYLDKISSLGLKLHSTSKWMNTALFKSEISFDIQKLLGLPFVQEVKIVKTPGIKSISGKLDFALTQDGLPPYDRPLTMVNGATLHSSGFTGKGVFIAILDGGFFNADKISSLNDLRIRNGIRGTHDFVNNGTAVYNAHNHGTAVLSVLAGDIPGKIKGTAPGAEYLLLKTEDVASEFPCEEDFWAAGAEFADSAGVDIISSSLGYFNFDDSTLNYKTSDLDGNTSFVTRVADIAASKGILVVNSAGNERDGIWKYIIFPADGDSVLAAGAVDGNTLIAGFSSAGPSADNRVKPDNVAMGVSVPVQVENSIGRASGTSFSCPVLSGMAACLLQAVPAALNNDIIMAMHESADRYHFPDSLYGYGIPDMVKALTKLQDHYLKIPDDYALISPNPSFAYFEIIFRDPPGDLTIEIFTMTGRLITRKNFTDYEDRNIFLTDLQHREQGIYLVRIKTSSKVTVHKIIKLKN